MVSFFDAADRHEVKEILSSLDDLFRFAPRLRKTVQAIEARASWTGSYLSSLFNYRSIYLVA